MIRLTTLDIYNELKLLIDLQNFRYDIYTNQNFVEFQDCHFIADSKYIVKHNKIIYDKDWYIKYYDPILTIQQFNENVWKLREDKYSRRAILYMGDKVENSICTISMQMLIDNFNRLNWIVNMRSNNVIKYTTDFEWQDGLFNKACKMLNINKGIMYWNAGSMHVYEEDFDLFKNIIV